MTDIETSWGRISLPRDALMHFSVSTSGFRHLKAVVIGRNPGLSLRVNHRLVSAIHCTIREADDGSVTLSDDSVNGTWVNDTLVHNDFVELKDGDTVAVVKHKKTCVSFVVWIKKANLDQSSAAVVYDLSKENVEDEEEPPPTKRLKSNRPKLDSVQPAIEMLKSEKKADDMADILSCSICFEIINDCVSIQHCLHNFCNECLGPWIKQSRNCPQCRIPVETVSRNHTLNSIIESYLAAHPGSKRSKSDEAANRILPPGSNQIELGKQIVQSSNDYELRILGSSRSSEIVDLTRMGSSLNPLAAPFVPRSQGFGIAIPPISCRRCEEMTSSQSTSQSTSLDYSNVPLCQPNQVHLLCNCCYQLFPRVQPAAAAAIIPATDCEVCKRSFCGLTWKCLKAGCKGCLAAFKDMQFSDADLNHIIDKNDYESIVLRDFLFAQQKNWKNLLTESSVWLDSGAFKQTSARPITADTVVCFGCAVKNFRQLAYLYRQAIPNEELPPEIRSRPDCHWGKNCRTQNHNQDHAERFNHICEQTRQA